MPLDALDGPTSASLEQSLGLGKRLSASLREGQLRAEVTRWGQVSRWSVPAGELYPHTNEFSWRNGKLLTAAAILLVLAALTFFFAVGARPRIPEDFGVPGTMLAVLLVAAIGCIVAWWRLWRHCVRVLLRDGQAALDLFADKPSKEAVDAFLGALLCTARESAGSSAEQDARWASAGATATEIRRFHALRRQGLLTEDEFREKKRELLARLLEA